MKLQQSISYINAIWLRNSI